MHAAATAKAASKLVSKSTIGTGSLPQDFN